jgi:hypothetical protein
MTNLTIEVPDELARGLQGMAAAREKSVQQLAIERLSSLLEPKTHTTAGSPAVLLRAIEEPPHLQAIDVDELDAAMAAGRLPIQALDPFST